MAFIPGNTGTASSFPDGFTGSPLANVETISATKVLTSADRRVQILTPSGALRIAQLPATAIIGEGWSLLCAAGSAFSLQVNASNGTVITTLAPGESTWVNAITATPTDAANWALQIPSTVLSNGTVSTPALRFTGGGSDTGIYSPALDQIAISTAGVQRLLVSETGAITIGPSSLANSLYQTINGSIVGRATASQEQGIFGGAVLGRLTANAYFDATGNTERAIKTTTGWASLNVVAGNLATDVALRLQTNYQDAQTANSAVVTTNQRTPLLITQEGAWTIGSTLTEPSHRIYGAKATSGPVLIVQGYGTAGAYFNISEEGIQDWYMGMDNSNNVLKIRPTSTVTASVAEVTVAGAWTKGPASGSAGAITHVTRGAQRLSTLQYSVTSGGVTTETTPTTRGSNLVSTVTSFTDLSTTARNIANGLSIFPAGIHKFVLINVDGDEASFEVSVGFENGVAFKFSPISGSNANCSISGTSTLSITGLGDGRTYTLAFNIGSGTATLASSTTATGTTTLYVYSVRWY